jgi:DNA-binding NtrC family response regulator
MSSQQWKEWGTGMRCKIVDYRTDFCSILAEKLGSEFTLQEVSSSQESKNCDVMLVAVPAASDPAFAEQLAALTAAARNSGEVPVVALLPASDRSLNLRVLSEGAYDCFVETASMAELRLILRRAAQFRDLSREVMQLREAAEKPAGFGQIITTTERMKAACSLAAKAAATCATVLLTGESGTGKELMAQAIHSSSQRSKQPFVALSCASLPEHLIEAELFGHEKGAFTGAVGARRGRFEAAGEGTIFLDEIGDLPPTMQVKLLRVLQERTFERLGSNEPRAMGARVICATHRSLKSLVNSGLFRADLYYRIATVEVELPPLRERRGDILPLAQIFLRKFALRHHRPASRFAAGVMATLQEYAWPGNVRELQNVVERAVVVCDGSEVHVSDLPPELSGIDGGVHSSTFDEEVRNFKRRLIQRTLAQTGHNKVQAARLLGIARSSLHRLIDELEIESVDDLLIDEPQVPKTLAAVVNISKPGVA